LIIHRKVAKNAKHSSDLFSLVCENIKTGTQNTDDAD
jgi:hypothetical protein